MVPLVTRPRMSRSNSAGEPADDKPKDDGITGKRGGDAGDKQDEKQE